MFQWIVYVEIYIKYRPHTHTVMVSAEWMKYAVFILDSVRMNDLFYYFRLHAKN